MSTTPIPRRRILPGILGLLAFLAWLSVAWTFWQSQTIWPRQTLLLDLPHYSFLTAPAGSPFAIINPSKDELAFLNAATGQKEVILKGDMHGVYRVSAARDRKTLATFMSDGMVKVWHRTEGGELTGFQLPALVYVACSPDGKMVAGHGPKENTARLWDVPSQKQVAAFDGHLGSGDDAFPDGRTLATVTAEGVKLWDLPTRQPRLTLAKRVRLYAIAPDGRSLATCDVNDRLTLWDCATGQQLANYQAPDDAQLMFFSPRGSKLGFSISYPNSTWYDSLSGWFGVHRGFELLSLHEETTVLDAATGQQRGQVPGFASNVVFADDKTLATLSKAGDAIQLWDLPPRTALHPTFVAWACLGAAIVLTGAWWYTLREGKRITRVAASA